MANLPLSRTSQRELQGSQCSQAVRSGFRGRPEGRGVRFFGWILSKSCLLLLVSPILPITALNTNTANKLTTNLRCSGVKRTIFFL